MTVPQTLYWDLCFYRGRWIPVMCISSREETCLDHVNLFYLYNPFASTRNHMRCTFSSVLKHISIIVIHKHTLSSYVLSSNDYSCACNRENFWVLRDMFEPFLMGLQLVDDPAIVYRKDSLLSFYINSISSRCQGPQKCNRSHNIVFFFGSRDHVL